MLRVLVHVDDVGKSSTGYAASSDACQPHNCKTNCRRAPKDAMAESAYRMVVDSKDERRSRATYTW